MNSLFSLLVPILLTSLSAPLVIGWYKRMRWLDDPKQSSHPKVLHVVPLPRGGGIVVAIALIGTILLMIPLSVKVIGILIGTLILMILGIWDDLADPHPLIRLGLLGVAATVAVAAGISIPFVTNPFGGIITLSHYPVLALGLAILWIVWCMNIVNFSTGLDGQMPGYVAIAALTIAALSTRFFPDPEQLTVFHLSLIVAGSFLGFLFWNMYPQKMMSGFGASTIAGYYLAVLSIFSQAKLATAILVLAIPMSDAIYVIASRLYRGRSPFWGDRSHLHHALLDSGFTKRQVAFIYWGGALVLGLLSLGLNSGQKAFAILLIAAVVCIIGVWLRLGIASFGKSDRDNG